MTPAEFKQARKSLGLTQPALGQILGYGQQHISDMERGRPIPNAVALAMRAMLELGLPDDWPAYPSSPGGGTASASAS